MSDNILSYSSIALVVYLISALFFILLVGFLFVVGLTPMRPCFSCSKCWKSEYYVPDKTRELHEEKIRGCPRFLKKISSPCNGEKDWNFTDLV